MVCYAKSSARLALIRPNIIIFLSVEMESMLCVTTVAYSTRQFTLEITLGGL